MMIYFFEGRILVLTLHVPGHSFTINEPRCEKTGLRGFRPGPTLTRFYNHPTCLDD